MHATNNLGVPFCTGNLVIRPVLLPVYLIFFGRDILVFPLERDLLQHLPRIFNPRTNQTYLKLHFLTSPTHTWNPWKKLLARSHLIKEAKFCRKASVQHAYFTKMEQQKKFSGGNKVLPSSVFFSGIWKWSFEYSFLQLLVSIPDGERKLT